MSETHPSYLALDAFALDQRGPVALQTHVATCPRCQAHVARVQPDRQTLPVWLQADARLKSPEFPRPVVQSYGVFSRLAQRWWLWALPAAVPAVLLLWVLRPGDPSPEPYTGIKSATPAVWAYVRHGESTSLWDGMTALVPGDRLRLKVDPLRYPLVSVFGKDEANQWRVLWSGKVERQGQMSLPAAWQVDDRPGAEHIVVVFSSRPVRVNDVDALRGDRRPDGIWIQELWFEKIVPER